MIEYCSFEKVLCCTIIMVLIFWAVPTNSSNKDLSDAQIAKEILQDNNRLIIEEFLKYELKEVNDNVTRPLLPKHPSLVFFIKQAERGPLKNLLFLEEQVHKLRDAQKNIDSLPYSVVFLGNERKKILDLKPTADRIISYGIPLMKRDFYKVITAAKELADKKRKHPMQLIPDPSFRDAIYRHVEPTPESLDNEMGKLSEGELICMRLGWVLEEVTVTKIWLAVNDNKLPDPDDYMVFRKKRSEYWQKRLKRIFPTSTSSKSTAGSTR